MEFPLLAAGPVPQKSVVPCGIVFTCGGLLRFARMNLRVSLLQRVSWGRSHAGEDERIPHGPQQHLISPSFVFVLTENPAFHSSLVEPGLQSL